MNTKNKKTLIFIFLIGFIIYTLSILWTNFNCAQWYNFDAYSDALVARFMSEKKSIFPDNWIFGNQFYVVATANIAAIIYAIFKNSILSIGLASSIYMMLIFASFIWCTRTCCKKTTLIIGLFCISGAVLVSSSASQDINGMQLFFTMASYYACYVFCILMTLGMYIKYRFNLEIKYRLALLCFLIALNFALGMQSLREMLILNIPLIITELIFTVFSKKINKKSMLFCGIMAISNLIGVVLIKYIGPNNSPIISDISLNFNVTSITSNFMSGLNELAVFSGLRFFNESIKWWPLAAIGIGSWIVVVYALILILKNKELTPLSTAVVFCWISILCVLAVATFAFKTRSIYYFVWFLLVVFSICYIVEKVTNGKIKTIILISLVLCGIVNYFFNFYPDIKKYKEQSDFYDGIVDRLISENIDCIYTDLATQPTIAAYSKDKIVSGTVEYDYGKSTGHLLKPVDTLKPKDFFENQENYNSYIVLSNGIYGSTSSFEMMNWCGEDYTKELMNNLELIREEIGPYTTYYIYRFNDGLISKK